MIQLSEEQVRLATKTTDRESAASVMVSVYQISLTEVHMAVPKQELCTKSGKMTRE